MDRKAFETVVTGLKTTAEVTQKKAVDPSFAVELENYTRHAGVRALNDEDAGLVVKEIGHAAISHHQRLDGSAIRATIERMCRPKNGFDLCANVAHDVLEKHDRLDGMKKIEVDLADAIEKAPQ